MRIIFCLIICFWVSLFGVSGQNVSISNETVEAHSSAILDIFSTEKGLLIPRMTTLERDAISGPAESLLIFNTVTKCFETYVLEEWHTLWCLESEEPEPFECEDIVTDIEGNDYQTVEIGEQCWFAENLKTTKYNNGSDIPNVTENAVWNTLTTDAYCWYQNNYAEYGSVFGALYNWHAVNTGLLCPEGWSVATDEDWKQMEIHLGMTPAEADATGWRGTNQGAQLKDPSMEGTNTSGFTALPGGWRVWGLFSSAITTGAYFWTSTNIDADHASMRLLHNNNNQICRDISTQDTKKTNGMSVRCIKD